VPCALLIRLVNAYCATYRVHAARVGDGLLLGSAMLEACTTLLGPAPPLEARAPSVLRCLPDVLPSTLRRAGLPARAGGCAGLTASPAHGQHEPAASQWSMLTQSMSTASTARALRAHHQSGHHMEAPSGLRCCGMLLQVAGQTEVKAQIKLRFRTSTGQPVVCIRSFQVRSHAFCPPVVVTLPAK
jgi:hypothetical protein